MRILIAFLFFSFSILAQDTNTFFEQAAKSYEQKEYTEALDHYKEIHSLGLYSSDLYYNMANCYYKLQQNAEAVLYYEKALKLNPSDEDAVFNLKLIQLQLVDKLAQVPQPFYKKWVGGLKKMLTIDQWAKLGLICLFIFCGFFITFLFTKTHNLKKRSFGISIYALFVALFSLSLAYYSHKTLKTEAVLMEANTYIKSAPSTQSEDMFILHEGTKVQVLEIFNDWTKIKLSDGMIGWLESKTVEEI